MTPSCIKPALNAFKRGRRDGQSRTLTSHSGLVMLRYAVGLVRGTSGFVDAVVFGMSVPNAWMALPVGRCKGTSLISLTSLFTDGRNHPRTWDSCFQATANTDIIQTFCKLLSSALQYFQYYSWRHSRTASMVWVGVNSIKAHKLDTVCFP